MKITSYSSAYTARRPRPPQFKFNNLFNEHFPWLNFLSILSRKNWRGRGELLLKNDAMDGFAYKPFYCRAGFTLRGAPGTLGIFPTSSCQKYVKIKKVLPSVRVAPGTVPYGKSGPGYCITFIKLIKLCSDEGLR